MKSVLRVIKKALLMLRKSNRKIFKMKSAIKNREFTPYYQPIIDAKKKRIIGYEALARWVKKDKIILPDKFINHVELYGLMEDFTNVIIEKVVRDLRKFSENIWISINISTEHLESDILLKKLIKLNWPAPYRLKFELTENKRIINKEKAFDTIKYLKSKGYSFKLDDYGTGFGNAELLLYLKFTEIKIDRIFISNILISDNQKRILKSLIDFAKCCNFNVIVEGVENISQAMFLIDNGIFEHQGYLYSKPLPIEEIIGIDSHISHVFNMFGTRKTINISKKQKLLSSM